MGEVVELPAPRRRRVVRRQAKVVDIRLELKKRRLQEIERRNVRIADMINLRTEAKLEGDIGLANELAISIADDVAIAFRETEDQLRLIDEIAAIEQQPQSGVGAVA